MISADVAANDTKPSDDPAPSVSNSTRQRKKRRWDQPAEPLESTSLDMAGVHSLGICGTSGTTVPGTCFSGPLMMSVQSAFAGASQSTVITQNAAAIVQKLNQVTQPKIQDELIAREIVINDAEALVRYKLTKRQTQEEIQRSTGAVVITRGKYRPPNGLPESEKPLYLHISAGSHLKDTAERIKAVDWAAAMVEEILTQGQGSLPMTTYLNSALSNGQISQQPISTCVFLGFDADPSSSIASRICGPNDQYINHIMNETGATVVLRGRGSRNLESSNTEDSQLSLHLYLTSSNARSLEDARILAENLLDTICAEFGASRLRSSSIYNAVPPPQQLVAGIASSIADSVSAGPVSTLATQLFTPNVGPLPSGSTIHPPGTLQPGGGLDYGNAPSNTAGFPFPPASRGTSYSGYGGIYPQATPLQQVALVLRHAPALSTSMASTSQTSALLKMDPSPEMEKRPHQKRKFQECSISSTVTTPQNQNSQQDSEFHRPGSDGSGSRCLFSDGMPPPPPKSMAPPLPKFSSQYPLNTDTGKPAMNMVAPLCQKFSPPQCSRIETGEHDLVVRPRSYGKVSSLNSLSKHESRHLDTNNMIPPPPKFSSQMPAISKSDKSTDNIGEPISDPLLKLVEYGEDEDSDSVGVESPGACPSKNHSTWDGTSKPFWAV